MNVSANQQQKAFDIFFFFQVNSPVLQEDKHD
jgi:hypothetical protein